MDHKIFEIAHFQMNKDYVPTISAYLHKVFQREDNNPNDPFYRYDNVSIRGAYYATGTSAGFNMFLDLSNILSKLKRVFLNSMVSSKLISNLTLIPRARLFFEMPTFNINNVLKASYIIARHKRGIHGE